MPRASEDLVGPVARSEVEEDRAGAVGAIGRVLAGQAQPHVVLRQQDVPRARPCVGLVLAHPEDLGRREAGERVVAGDRDEPLAPDDLADAVALGGRPLVVPEDRGADRLAGIVEERQPVHLAREPDGRHVAAARARIDARTSRIARLGRRPPELGVLLAPERLRRARLVLGRGDADELPAAADEDRLRRGRGDVEAQDDGPDRAAHADGPVEGVAADERSASASPTRWTSQSSRWSVPSPGARSTSGPRVSSSVFVGLA